MIIALMFAISFGCNTGTSNSDSGYSIKIVDSINVDYFGNLKLKDYDPNSDRYLLSNEGMIPILEVNSAGDIIGNFEVSHEGPDAVPNPGSVGYLNGELLIYDMDKGFVIFNEDKSISNEIRIPYQHSYLVFPPHLPLMERKDEDVFYLKPLIDEDFIDGMGEKFYKNYYNKPLLEKLNLRTGDITTHLEIPDQSIFKDGMNHGIYIPIIKNRDKKWLVSTWFDPVIYLFEQNGEGFSFVREIDLQIEGLVKYESVSMKNSNQFFDINENTRAGNINDILLLDEYTLVVYRKGLTADEQAEIKAKFAEQDYIEIEKKDPFYAVVLDVNYNVVANEVPFPLGVYYPNVINKDNEIVALKNADLFSVEEDFLTLYKMKLNVE